MVARGGLAQVRCWVKQRRGNRQEKFLETKVKVEARMKEKLMVALRPTRLDVVNESELHAGHRSSPGTGESHFRILIVSELFSGKSRVERHRMVNAVLVDEVGRQVHALALNAYAPGEPIN